jgi:NAD(P)H-dependent FMN reductase
MAFDLVNGCSFWQGCSLMKYLILSCSLHPKSRSRIMALRLQECLGQEEARLVDLAETALPLCDGSSAYSHPAVQELVEQVTDADGIVVASPVYNYDLSAAAKNVVELTGRAWTGKVVGLMCAAGGQGSYMAGMPFLNSLMLDFRTYVVPRFVYASGVAFAEGRIVDEEVDQRVQQLGKELVRITRALRLKENVGGN